MPTPVSSFKFKFALGFAAVMSLLVLTGGAGVLQVIADGRGAPPAQAAEAAPVPAPDELRHEVLNHGAAVPAADEHVAVPVHFSLLWESAVGGGPLVSPATRTRVLGLHE